MTDFEQRKPRALRQRAGAKAPASGLARAQTTRSGVEQQEHRKQYQIAHVQRTRELERAAKARAIAYAQQITEPIVGVGPFGTFTIAQLLTLEFARHLPSHLSPETMERDITSISASGVQRFLCWDNKEKTSFFPIVLTEDWTKGMVKMKCACLEKKAGSIYTIDPHWKGESEASKDKAFINLMFEVPGEGLREVEGGLETTSGKEKAWSMQRVQRQ